MTLQEAKDQVAKKHGWPDWWSVDFNRSVVGQETMRDEAAELYAQSQVNEAYSNVIKFLDSFAGNTDELIEELKKLKR